MNSSEKVFSPSSRCPSWGWGATGSRSRAWASSAAAARGPSRHGRSSSPSSTTSTSMSATLVPQPPWTKKQGMSKLWNSSWTNSSFARNSAQKHQLLVSTQAMMDTFQLSAHPGLEKKRFFFHKTEVGGESSPRAAFSRTENYAGKNSSLPLSSRPQGPYELLMLLQMLLLLLLLLLES